MPHHETDMTRLAICWILLLATCGTLRGEDLEAARVETWYHLLRPTNRELSIYQLDWEGSLETARQRAARERRPICLMIVHAKYGDLASGHC